MDSTFFIFKMRFSYGTNQVPTGSKENIIGNIKSKLRNFANLRDYATVPIIVLEISSQKMFHMTE